MEKKKKEKENPVWGKKHREILLDHLGNLLCRWGGGGGAFLKDISFFFAWIFPSVS